MERVIWFVSQFAVILLVALSVFALGIHGNSTVERFVNKVKIMPSGSRQLDSKAQGVFEYVFLLAVVMFIVIIGLQVLEGTARGSKLNETAVMARNQTAFTCNATGCFDAYNRKI